MSLSKVLLMLRQDKSFVHWFHTLWRVISFISFAPGLVLIELTFHMKVKVSFFHLALSNNILLKRNPANASVLRFVILWVVISIHLFTLVSYNRHSALSSFWYFFRVEPLFLYFYFVTCHFFTFFHISVLYPALGSLKYI